MAIPPQSDAYWVGEAGPGPSYLDADGGGAGNAWTTRNTVFMTWNLLHLARMLKDAGGIPAHGNAAADWDLGAGASQPRVPQLRANGHGGSLGRSGGRPTVSGPAPGVTATWSSRAGAPTRVELELLGAAARRRAARGCARARR